MANKLIVEFGADTSALRGELAALGGTVQQSVAGTTSQVGTLFDKVGEHFTSMRHLGDALAVGLGLNFENIANSLAEMVTGFTEQEKEALEEIDKLGDEYSKKLDAQIEKKNTNAQNEVQNQNRINALYKEQQGIFDEIAKRQKEYDDFVVTSYDDIQAQTYLEEQLNGVKNNNVRLEQIKNELQDRAIKGAELEAAANKDVTTEVTKQVQSQQTRQKVQEDYQALVAKDVADNREYLILEQKAQTGLTEAEAQKLSILNLQFKQKQNIAEIDDLLGKKLEGTITPAEQLNLQTLIMQETVLEKQLADKQSLYGATQNQQKGEASVTAEMKNQEAIQQSLLNLKKQGESPGGDLGVLQLAGGIRTYNNPQDQAAYEAGLIKSTTEQIDNQIQYYQGKIDQLNASGSSYAPSQIPILKGYIDALDQREKNVRDYLFNPNYSDALGQGLLGEQMATAGTTPTAEVLTNKVVNSLTTISGQLSAAGFNAAGVIGG